MLTQVLANLELPWPDTLLDLCGFFRRVRYLVGTLSCLYEPDVDPEHMLMKCYLTCSIINLDMVSVSTPCVSIELYKTGAHLSPVAPLTALCGH